ncbi:unnamed protein product [Rhizoctonia solani]|uniref:BTB domain-containing protein n=1 Tax=Rhizoctonia solani TaxID=456999 RepID=A0A8H3I249_9AGAM|nr:unnamed protein product [Rhizoctonia solani]
MSAEYTIVVGDKAFRLSKAQIEYDAPNFFTSHFLASDQSGTRQLEIPRDPYLFGIIMRYLNGYHVLPLHPTLVPPHCTSETALADLRADARFYRLNGLSQLLSPSSLISGNQLGIIYVEIAGSYSTESDRLEPTETLDKVAKDFSLKLSSEQEYEAASQLGNFITVPRNTKGGDLNVFYSGLVNERIVRRVLQHDAIAAMVRDWELLGWNRDYPSDRYRQTCIFVKLWTKSEPAVKESHPDVPVTV